MATSDPETQPFYLVDDGVVRVLFARGDIGIEVAEAFRQSIQEATGSGRAAVVLDLSEVTFMDSTGLSVILAALRQAWAQGQAFLVAGPLKPSIASLLSITMVDRLLTVHPNRDEALRVLRR